MAPVYNYRHVELDNIGRGKRIVTPPHGRHSSIFDATGSPGEVTPRRMKSYSQSNIFSPVSNGHTPSEHRKSKSYMESRIFSDDESDCMTPRRDAGSRTPSASSTDSCGSGKYINTQFRLFGPPEETTPRRSIDRMRSNIFSPSAVSSAPPSYVRRNPITGEL